MKKYGNLVFGENILALRLVSELPDLRAGYANPCPFGSAQRAGSMNGRESNPDLASLRSASSDFQTIQLTKKNKEHFVLLVLFW